MKLVSFDIKPRIAVCLSVHITCLWFKEKEMRMAERLPESAFGVMAVFYTLFSANVEVGMVVVIVCSDTQ
jgi:hypothetical protein